MALTIRDVSPTTRDALADEARARGQSLQAYLLAVLDREAGFRRNRQILAEAERRATGAAATSVTTEQVAEMIRQGRGERTVALLDAVRAEDAPE